MKRWYKCALDYIVILNQLWRFQHITQCILLHVGSLCYDSTQPCLISTAHDKATATYKADKNKSGNFTYQTQISNMIHLGDKSYVPILYSCYHQYKSLPFFSLKAKAQRCQKCIDCNYLEFKNQERSVESSNSLQTFH